MDLPIFKGIVACYNKNRLNQIAFSQRYETIEYQIYQILV